MTRTAYAWLYSSLSAYCFVYAISVHALTQGLAPFAELPFVDSGRPVISAYFALMATGLMLLATGGLAVMHARAAPGGSALPLVGLGDAAEGVDPARRSTRFYVGVMFVLLIALPTFSLAHFARIVPDRGAVWSEGPTDGIAVRAVCAMGMPWATIEACASDERARVDASAKGKRLRLAENLCDAARAGGPSRECKATDLSLACEETPRKCAGVAWFPVLSPMAIFLGALAGAGGLILNLWALVKGLQNG